MVKTIFIDRDGVINKDPGGWTRHEYVTDWKDFHFLPGAMEALKLLNRNRIRVVIVSNQAGVGKGFFSKEALQNITRMMLYEIKGAGGNVCDVTYCIHVKEAGCNCRKPRPGMIEEGIKKYGVVARDTYMIGDSEVDVLAGKAAGVGTILILSGKTSMSDMKKWAVKPDHMFKDLLEAVKWILSKEKRKSDRSVRRLKGG